MTWMSRFALPISVFAGFALAALAPGLARYFKWHVGKVTALLPLILTAYLAFQLPGIAIGSSLRAVLPWSGLLGVSLSFVLDGLSGLFALVICFIGTLILVYAGDYLHGRSETGKFYALLLSFMASMLGVVLSDNLISLYVFWELTGLSSFLLIGFEHQEEESRGAALQALLVTSLGGLAMLAGFLVLGERVGSYEISSLLAHGEMLRSSDSYLPALLLILAGAFSKSAQFPFHFWLPNAMNAPTPVSAYLHSATMVKAGIYLLARLSPILGGTSAWFSAVAGTGVATMCVGSILALGQTDLKLLLAYMTIMALGVLTLLLGIGSALAIQAAMVFLIVHSLYKGALFLVAGAIENETGTRDVLKLRSLAKRMPVLAAVAAAAAFSMAGLPPLLGFIGKELVYKAALDVAGVSAVVFIVAAVFSKTAAVLVSGVVAIKPFFDRSCAGLPGAMAGIHEPPFGMLLAPSILAALGIAFGLEPEWLSRFLIAPAVEAVSGVAIVAKLHTWSEINLATWLSGVSIGAGALGYFSWPGILPKLQSWEGRVGKMGPAHTFESGLLAMQRLARAQTRFLQGGTFGSYLAVIWTVVIAGFSASLWRRGAPISPPAWAALTYHEWAIAALIMAGSLYALFARSMLAAFVALGVSGYLIALFYVLYGAPDLAITQILVETLTIVIATLVMTRMAEFPSFREPRRVLLRDALLSAGFGLTLAALLSMSLRSPFFDPRLSEYFSEKSAPEGFGKNIVNVILVDFRAIDTMGEITVVALAALGVHGLLHEFFEEKRKSGAYMHSIVLKVTSRILLVLLLLFSLFLLLRGHDLPGGGFAGGLVAAGAWSLYAVAQGPALARYALRMSPELAIAAGYLVAAFSGWVSFFVGSSPWEAYWLDLGILRVGSPLLFDLGVFLVVIGATLTVIFALEEV